MIVAAFVVAGLLIGSFLNVVIARVPEGRSIWRPGSACPGCGTAIAWHDNVPLVSFAALRARCRACGMSIPWRYPIVEAVTGALFGAAALAFGATPWAIAAAALLALDRGRFMRTPARLRALVERVFRVEHTRCWDVGLYTEVLFRCRE